MFERGVNHRERSMDRTGLPGVREQICEGICDGNLWQTDSGVYRLPPGSKKSYNELIAWKAWH